MFRPREGDPPDALADVLRREFCAEHRGACRRVRTVRGDDKVGPELFAGGERDVRPCIVLIDGGNGALVAQSGAGARRAVGEHGVER